MENQCGEESRSVHLAAILENIPRSDGEAKPLTLLCPAYKTIGNTSCEGCTKTLLILLKVFDAVTIIEDDEGNEPKIKAKGQTAIYFIRSLAVYIRRGLTLVPNWNEKAGVGESPVPSLALKSGAHLVYQMEYHRAFELNDRTPIRSEHVSQAIIKARVRGQSKPMYFFQYDEKSLQFQLIGGRKKPDDPDSLSVMKREIAEELTQNQLVYNKDYELKELVSDLKAFDLSRTFGAYSECHFAIYQLKSKRRQLILGPNDRWITLHELLSGKDKNGVRISRYFKELDNRLPGGLEGLPLSLEKVQKQPFSEIVKDRRGELTGIIITILGIIIAIVLMLLS
jgi:hypothetical protein